MGTPEFALPVLSGLLDGGHNIVGVYTRPDRPAGRGRRTEPSPAKRVALQRGLAVYQPTSLRSNEAQAEMAGLGPDVLVVAAYGVLLPNRVLDLPRLGCLNVHPSLLPRYRGASPVHSAILNGDASTGVTVMEIDEGMDTGPIVAQRETAVDPRENAAELTERLFEMGAALLTDVLPSWAAGEVQSRSQDDSAATVTKRLSKADGEIDWGQPADRVARQVRAYHPWPGSFTRWNSKIVKIVEAQVATPGPGSPAAPGHVLALPEGRVGVAAGDGVLELQRMQLEGRRAVSAGEFLQGYGDFLGSALGA